MRLSDEAGLSPLGVQQAEFLAKRCVKLPVNVILSSPLNRARETADIIASEIGKPIEYSDLFVERKRPSIYFGRPKNDEEATAADETIRNNFGVLGFRHADEENFEDLSVRAGKALGFLADRQEEHILVVTHGFISRIIVARAMFGEELSPHECQAVVRTLRENNTGITVIKHNSEREHPWRLWAWNDHAHLG